MAEYSKSLLSRSNDFEWSQIEYINFEKGDQGFVRPVARTNGLCFYLDPSKLLRTQKPEVFVLKPKVPIPPAHSFIKVTVAETEEVDDVEPIGNWNYFYVGDEHNNLGYKNPTKTYYKYVSGWEPLDITSALLKDGRFQDLRARFSDYMTGCFIAPEDDLAMIEACMSMYCASSPAFVAQKGGVDTSIFGKTRQWASFTRSTNFIRPEFRKSNFPYFYKPLKKNENPDITKCIEVNRAYNNRQEVPILLPMVLPSEFEKVAFFNEKNKAYRPYVQAFMIDMIHIDPIVSPKLSKFIEEFMYELINDIMTGDCAYYNQDIGSIASKLPISLARTNLKPEASKEDVIESANAWANMYYQARQHITSPLSNDQMYKLSQDARTLYLELKNRYDTGMSMKVVDVKRDSKVFEWNFEDALQNLIRAGVVFMPNVYEIGLVNLKQ